MDLLYVALALFGGVVPALFWLWFWLKEDAAHPEPGKLIALAFLGGMLVVPIVLVLQRVVADLYTGAALTLVWVIMEEALKYAAALVLVLWHKAVNEPIDYIVYMIVVALGFSALENTLFLFNPLTQGEIVESLLTGKFRFLGATLLHVISSAAIGVALAFAYHRPPTTKLLFGMVGLCSAVALHALFNFLIIGSSGETILAVFALVWFGVIALFFAFEKLKRTSHPR